MNMNMNPFGGGNTPTPAQAPVQAPAPTPSQPGFGQAPSPTPAQPGGLPGFGQAPQPQSQAQQPGGLPGFGQAPAQAPTPQPQPGGLPGFGQAPAMPSQAQTSGEWHLGQPVVPAPGSMPTPGPYVERRKPVTLPNGQQVTTVPGEPEYTMPRGIREYEPKRDHFGRYVHEHPKLGGTQSFTRATTIAKKLDSGDSLIDWKQRKTIEGLVRYPELLNGLDVGKLGTTNEYQLKRTMKEIAENAAVAAGAADGREFGTALHAWTEAVDHGSYTFEQVPDAFKPYVASYMQQLSRHSIEVVPEYVERIMYNDIVGSMGTIDRIYRLPTGELVIGDIKTSANLEYGWTSIALQMAQYATATHMLSEDGTTWEPMPPIRTDIAIIASIPHTPRDRGAHCDLHIINVEYGQKLLYLARDIQFAQGTAKKVIPMAHSEQPTSAEDAIAWVRSGMPPLGTPGSNPLAQLEGVADKRTQEAMDAMDGDVSRYESMPVVSTLVQQATESDNADDVAQLGELARVLSGALRSGRLEVVAGLASGLMEAPAESRDDVARGLDVAAVRANVRSTRLRTREDTAREVAEREQRQEVKAQVAGSSVPKPSVVPEGGLGTFPQGVFSVPQPGQQQQTSQFPAPQQQQQTSQFPAPQQQQPSQFPTQQQAVADDTPVGGIRPSVRAVIESVTDPSAMQSVYDERWSTQEVELATRHMESLASAMYEITVAQIEGAATASAIRDLWEPWWSQELTEYAQQKASQLPQ